MSLSDRIALAVTLVSPVIDSHHHLLEIATTVNQAIQQTHYMCIINFVATLLTLSGMASSVRVSVAAWKISSMVQCGATKPRSSIHIMVCTHFY